MTLKQIWNSQTYQKIAAEKVVRKWKQNPGYQSILKASQQAKTILECGCSSGAFLSILSQRLKKKTLVGIDISYRALTKIKTKIISKTQADIRKLPIATSSFDLVYSVHALEHINHPERAIQEMIRVLKPKGQLIIICPNLGSPLAKLPGKSWQNTLLMLPSKLFLSLKRVLFAERHLNWKSLTLVSTSISQYEPDFDAVNQPSLQTLIQYLKYNNLTIINYSSGLDWQDHLNKANHYANKNIIQKMFQHLTSPIYWLGRRNIPPFKYFGFMCLVVAQK